MDLNKLANQLASGMAENQLAESGMTADPLPGSLSVPREAVPRGVVFQDTPIRLGSVLDHTLLNPAATAADVDRHCDEALRYRVAAVCVNPLWVARCADRLRGSGVAVASVAGFPFGTTPAASKAAEAALAVRHGATEVETVIPLGLVKAGDYRALHADIEAVVTATDGALVKVILETASLTPMEILRSATVAGDAGAHYVKTSTGYSASGGATPEAVALLRLAVGDDLGVKASGGVRDSRTAFLMLASGATRIGSSAADAIADATGPGPRRLHELMHVPFQSSGSSGLPLDSHLAAPSPPLPSPSSGQEHKTSAPDGARGDHQKPAPHDGPEQERGDGSTGTPARVTPSWGTWQPR